MPDQLTDRAAPRRLYRIGRAPDPWAWPPWAFADPVTGTFGSRWDDPRGIYRVLYSSASVLGCFIECLARFRPDPLVVIALDAIVDEDDDLGRTSPAGRLSLSWLGNRRFGRGSWIDRGGRYQPAALAGASGRLEA